MNRLPAQPVQSEDIEAIALLPQNPGQTSIGRRGIAWIQPNHSQNTITQCIENYPQGAFTSKHADSPIGFVSAIRLPSERVLSQHDWASVTDSGTGGSHSGSGDVLYACRLVLTANPGHASLMEELIPLLLAQIELAKKANLKGVAFAAPFFGLSERSGTTDFQRAHINENHSLMASAHHLIGCAIHTGFDHEIALPNYFGTARHCALMVWRP